MDNNEPLAKAEAFYKTLQIIEGLYLEKRKQLPLYSLNNLYVYMEQLESIEESLEIISSKFYDSEIEKCKQITGSFLEKVCGEIKKRFD